MRNYFKLLLLVLVTFILPELSAQNKESFKLYADFDYPEEREKYEMWFYQGIKKLDFSLENDSTLINKDFKIIIEEYQDGRLHQQTVVIDTKEEPRLSKIKSDFKFKIYAQNLFNYEKIGFVFDRAINKKTFKTNDNFNDGDFSLRKINVLQDYLNFNLNEPFQIALITPPNRDPGKGEMGYCQVSQGGIEVEEWYNQYKISQFFLVYLEIG